LPQIAFTLRIGAEERNALKHLSEIERRPINQLLNEAIRNSSIRRASGNVALRLVWPN